MLSMLLQALKHIALNHTLVSYPRSALDHKVEIHSMDLESYLGKQFLLLSEQLFLRDPQVLQSGAGLPPLQSHSFTLLQDVLHLRDV